MELREIQKYIETLRNEEEAFKNQSNGAFSKTSEDKTSTGQKTLRKIRLLGFYFVSTIQFLELYFRIHFNKKSLNNKKIVFTARNFCNEVNGHLVDRIVKPLFTENIIFINPSKEIYISRINNSKVYNTGGFVKIMSLFIGNKSQSMKLFLAYRKINDLLLRDLHGKEVFMMFFYDLNGLSLVFSTHRDKFTLIEVQHGSIINYPPYINPSPVKIADIFYVKNRPTVDYLQTHLNRNFLCAYRLIPYPSIVRKKTSGLHLLYASTIDIHGLHPVLLRYISEVASRDIDLIIRLHPRERQNIDHFMSQLSSSKVTYRFDETENWLEGNPYENLIVISPWSSTIEDAYDNGVLSIIIDPVGKRRFSNLIDDTICFYSEDLSNTIKEIVSRIHG